MSIIQTHLAPLDGMACGTCCLKDHLLPDPRTVKTLFVSVTRLLRLWHTLRNINSTLCTSTLGLDFDTRLQTSQREGLCIKRKTHFPSPPKNQTSAAAVCREEKLFLFLLIDSFLTLLSLNLLCCFESEAAAVRSLKPSFVPWCLFLFG